MSDFYFARAAQSLREAEECTLANVRDRCLRSAEAWQIMADRSARIESDRRDRSEQLAVRDAEFVTKDAELAPAGEERAVTGEERAVTGEERAAQGAIVRD